MLVLPAEHHSLLSSEGSFAKHRGTKSNHLTPWHSAQDGVCFESGGAVALGEAAASDCGGAARYRSLLQLHSKGKEMGL